MIVARGMDVECLYGLYHCKKRTRAIVDEFRLHHQEYFCKKRWRKRRMENGTRF